MLRLLLILLITPCFSFGQTYFPFPDSNAVWSIGEGYWNQVWPFNFISWTYHHAVVGDTVIGTNSYKKVYASVDSTFNYGNASYSHAIREDTNKRIFHVQYNDTIEKLLYDFSIGLGDTAWIHPTQPGYMCFDSCMMVVDSVDSVQIGVSYRRRLHFSAHNDKWIEGIGSVIGLPHPAGHIIDQDLWLICFTENDTVKYGSGNCYTNTGINELINKHQFTIHPNPTTGIFTVQGATGEIQVYDLFGRLVLHTNKREIDMGGYPAGIYMVRVGKETRKLILH